MPTREELGAALRNADAAGDTAAARKLADAIRKLDGQGATPSPATPGPEIGPLKETVQMPLTVQQMPMDARRDWMRANAPSAVTQTKGPKMSRGGAATLGILDAAYSLPVLKEITRAPLNAMGMDDEKIDQDLAQALEDHPLSMRTGQVGGFLAGGGGSLWNAGTRGLGKAGAGLSKGLGTTSASAMDKALRYGGRLFGVGSLGLLENAAFNVVNEGRNRNREDGDVSGDHLAAGIEFAKEDALNPFAFFAPGVASGIFRIGKGFKTGGASVTPDAIAARVSDNLTPATGQLLDPEVIGALEPAAEKQLTRMLRREANVTPAQIRDAVDAFNREAAAETSLARLPSRLKDVLAEHLGEKVRKPIDDFLMGAANRKAGTSGGIVEASVKEDAKRLATFLEDSAGSRFGTGNRFESLTEAEDEMARIGREGYEKVFNTPVGGTTQDPGAVKWVGEIPKEPQGLLGFIRQQGGLKESFGQDGRGYMRGAVEGILGDVRKRPGLLNNKSGKTLDELRRDAQDAGFDIRDDEDFIRALSDELQSGQKTYRIGEAEDWEVYQDFLADQARRSDRWEPTEMDSRMKDLGETLSFYASSPLSRPLREVAAGDMLDVDAFIAKDPRRAAHWMQHTAKQKAEEALEKGDKVTANAYSKMRAQILRRLEAPGVAPGYREARLEFGDEYSNLQALTAGDRFLSIADDELKLGKFLKDMEGMTPRERDAAMLSIRDAILKPAMRRTEGGMPRMAVIAREPVLNALERLGPEGTAFANDVRKTAERVSRTQMIDPRTGSNTMNKQEAAKLAEDTVANPFVRMVSNALQNLGGDAAISGATGTPAPILTGRAALRKAGETLAGGRQRKIDQLSDVLTRDIGAAPRPSMSGDAALQAPASGNTKQAIAMLPSVGGPNVGMLSGGASGAFFPLPIDEDDTQAERWAKRGGMILAGALAGRYSGKMRAQLADDLNKVHVFGDAPPAGSVPKTQAGTSGMRPETAQQKDAIMGLLHMPQQQRAIFNTIEQQTGKIADKDVPAVIEMIETAAARGEAPEAIVRSGVDMMKSRGPSGMGFAGGDDLANMSMGGLVGGAAPADSTEDRMRNAAIMAGATGILGRVPIRAGGASAGAGGKPPKIKPDVPVAERKPGDPNLGTSLAEIMAQQPAPKRAPDLRETLARNLVDAPASAKPKEPAVDIDPDSRWNRNAAIVLGTGGAAVMGKQYYDHQKFKEGKRVAAAAQSVDPLEVRSQIEARLIDKLGAGSDAGATVERQRLEALDRVIEMEAAKANRPRGTEQQEAAREKLMRKILHQIQSGRPGLVDPDLRRLEEMDRVIGGRPKLPEAPSIKPEPAMQ